MSNEFEDFDLLEFAKEASAQDSKPPEPSEDDRIRLAYQAVTASADGIKVLQHFLSLTGYQERLVRTNSESEVNIHATVYNLAQRDMWMQVRKYLSATQLRAIENPED